MTKIVNLKNINLDDLNILKHPCMPNFSGTANETWVTAEDRELVATCSLWIENTPTYKDFKTGIIGDFFTRDYNSGKDLLLHSLSRLKECGLSYAIGPMNGNIWHSYRLITEYYDEQPFFMEQYTPKEWPGVFIGADFEEIATYYSAKSSQLSYEDEVATRFIEKKTELGLMIRQFSLDHFEQDLSKIHELSLKSFARNFLYTDITLPEFLNLYRKIVPYVDPNFFLLAEHKGKLVGYVFAIPDLLQKQRGEKVNSLIIKTIARDPERTYAGLGIYLVHEIHQRAAKRGFKNILHAFMHETNVSRKMSEKLAQVIRKYALYGKKL